MFVVSKYALLFYLMLQILLKISRLAIEPSTMIELEIVMNLEDETKNLYKDLYKEDNNVQ